MLRASPRCGTWPRSSVGAPAPRPVPACGECGPWWHRCVNEARPARSSRCCATRASCTPPRTTTTTGSPRRDSTRRRTGRRSTRCSTADRSQLAEGFGRRAGASTGTCLWGVWSLVAQMRERGETGSIVTLLCDPGELYTSTYYDDDWLAEKGLDPAPYRAQIDSLLDGGPL